MQTNYLLQDGLARQQVHGHVSTASSGVSSPTSIAGRPLSLDNLLINRSDSVRSKAPSISSKRSLDMLSPTTSHALPSGTSHSHTYDQYATVASPAVVALGGLPQSSSTFTLGAISSTNHQHHDYDRFAASPTGSSYSIASSSTATSATFPSTARSVLLPQNGHGVRTRVNILSASDALAASKPATKVRSVSSDSRVSSDTAATRLKEQHLHPQVENIGRQSPRLSSHIDPPPRVQSASANHSINRVMQNGSNALNGSHSDSTSSYDGRRAVSDSNSTARPALNTVPAAGTSGYRFPAPTSRTYDDNHTYTYGSSSTSAAVRGALVKAATTPAGGSDGTSEFGNLRAQPSSSIMNGSGMSSYAPLPSLAGSSANHLAQSGMNASRRPTFDTPPPPSELQQQHPPYRRSHTSDEIYAPASTVTPWEPSSDGALSRSNAAFTSHSSKPSRTHLTNIPKSLIPGGYDFSPSSASTHDSSHQYSRPSHQASSSSASAFAFARDRSASVPRTVSSLGNDSNRSSLDYQNQHQQHHHQIPNMPVIDASYQTAKQTLENGSMHITSQGDDSGHAQLTSAFSSSSHNASSRQSTEEENASAMSHDGVPVVAPLISPIPPKLDLDFGNSSAFSLDFGSDFGGSLGLSLGSSTAGISSSSLGLSFGDFGTSSSTAAARPALLPVSSAPQSGHGAEANVREKNDSTATTTMSSFLSLQDSTVSTHDSDSSLFLAGGLLDIPPLSGESDSTVKPEHSELHHAQQTSAEEGAKSSRALSPAKSAQKSPLETSPTVASPNQGASDSTTLATSSHAAVETVLPAQSSTRSQSRTDNGGRSELPASFISSTSFSRPASSLFMGNNAGASESGTTRKRLLENPAYKGDYTASDDSKRTTLSSAEQFTVKTSNNSSSANLPSQGVQQNSNARASFNKSLPPVPPKSPAQLRTQPKSGTVSSQSSSIERASPQPQLLLKPQEQNTVRHRGPVDMERRSYSEHSQSYNEERPSSTYRRQHSDSFSSSQGDFKTPQFGKMDDKLRSTSRASGSDTISMHSTSSTTAYASMEVTRNFGAPVAPEATRIYRASTDSDIVTRQGRSEVTRPRANTNNDLEGIKNPFEREKSTKEDIPLAALARPRMNARNAWPNGELRKRDAVTDKLLETVTAKLDVWILRHPERLMTTREAEHHNRSPSPSVTEAQERQVQAKPQAVTRIPPPSHHHYVEASTSAVQQSTRPESQQTPISSDTTYEVKNAAAVSSSMARMVNLKQERNESTRHAPLSLSSDDLSSIKPPSELPRSSEGSKPDPLQLSATSSSLPALTYSSSLGVATSSDSLPSTSKASETVRTPLTAVASSPSLDPAFATTVPLKILPKSRSGTLAGKTRKPLSPGVMQPWGPVWTEIAEALMNYKSALMQQKQERAVFSQTGLLPNFKNEELNALLHNRTLSPKQKNLLLDWVDALFEDLQGTPPNRGACLDGIAVIIESRLMNYFAFVPNTEGFTRYEKTIAALAAFAVEKLNGKAIFANTLGFAGKMLAAAFWNLEGVGLKLLRLLPAVKKQHIMRIYAESGDAECPGKFPSHLDGLAFGGAPTSYMKLFRPVRPGSEGDTYLYKASFPAIGTDEPTRQESTEGKAGSETGAQEISVEMSGNWLIRWTATDSDLPFAFMRAYHRQLSNYLPLYQPDVFEPITTAQLVKAPGYAFIAATLLEVCDALIHRNLRSVTTMAPSNTGVNANESANLAAGQKPKSLEIVSKRVIQTMFEIVGGALQAGSPASSPIAFMSAAMRHNFGSSVSMWIRAVTKKTSMWDTRGIFALLDLIEGLMYNICCPPYEEGVDEDDEVWIPSEVGLKLFDTKFILGFIKTILSKADNTTCLLRTLSFLYTEFQSFTLRTEDRVELCDKIILDDEVFNRLFLYYNVGVRGYFLRLLVYRLARLGSADDGKPASPEPSIISTLRLFEYRLEKIRKRHDEIDPWDDDWDSESSDEFRPRPKRSTVCSTWGVRNQPWTMDLARLARVGDSSDSETEERTKDNVEQVTLHVRESSANDGTDVGFDSGQLNRLLHTSSESLQSIRSSPQPLQQLPSVPKQPSPSQNAKKGNVAKSAKKVWNALTSRKLPNGPSSDGKKKGSLHEAISPYYEDSNINIGSPVEVALPYGKQCPINGRRSSSASAEVVAHSPAPSTGGKLSLDKKEPFPLRTSSTANEATCFSSAYGGAGLVSTSDAQIARPDTLKIDVPAPRLRKQSSRKSIRRGATSQAPVVNGRLATSAVSPRSRRSSLYSFDLDVETPRSDSFEIPRSPMLPSANGIVQSGSASPAITSKAGVLSLSPVAFGALLDGALNFDSLDPEDQNADKSGDRLNPNSHRRHKSVSSARNRSRPVSVASDRTGPSPRVSKRFSKRASILPAPALDLLKESPSEPVPKIPEQYKSPTSGTGMYTHAEMRAPSPEPYIAKLHPYAVRGLREYEDCLDEWELFVHRVKEEEGVDGRELAALIPRLQCAWPSTWEE